MTFTQTSFAPLHKALAAIAIAAMVLSTFAFAPLAFANSQGAGGPIQPDDAKVTICHANESGSFQTIHTSEHAIGGHFENNGTPKSGHEDDLLFPGEVDCPVTTGTITVTKVVVNDDGGSAKVKDFDLFVAATKVKSDHSEEFLPGTYAITESGAETANYDAVYTGACSTGSITVEAGKTYDCTITNNDKEPVVPPTYQCNDGVDNADPEDALVDMADPGCSGPTDNDETDPVVPPTYQCSDLIDNADPEDALVDMADPGCTSATDDNETDEVVPPTYQCSDLIDNADPEDTLVDYPADPGCTSATDDNETDEVVPPTYQCNDGVDNADPEDTLSDYPADPGCTGPTDNDETDPTVPPTNVCQTSANLLLNGSFETPVVNGDWAIFNPVSSWLISSDGLELWANGFYGGASQGAQNAELDGNQPTTITQAVTTIPGATYELRFDFSARPDADGAADNSVDALADGVLLMNVTASGADIASNTWTTHTKTFVASDASTDIALTDKGTANSYGSLVDNVCLLKVADPKPQTCSVTLVSNASDTTVVEKDAALAKLLTFIHSAWTASIPGASWIWGDDPVAAPVNGVVQNLERQFGFVGDVTSAKLYVAADNTYTATLNSSLAGADMTEYNFIAADEYDVASLINESGNNTLSFEVTNLPSSSNPAANPAGLMYKLVIEGNVTTDTDCVVPYDDETDPTPGSITLDKVVTGEGAEQNLKFTFGSWENSETYLSGNDAPKVFSNLVAKNYTISEANPFWTGEGYTLASTVCKVGDVVKEDLNANPLEITIALGEGENAVCTFTNAVYVAPVCSDGADNDGDGKTDYPADPGCSAADDGDETDAPVYACSDGLDNDGDGKTDYTNDPGCTGPTDNDETNSEDNTCSAILVSGDDDNDDDRDDNTTVVERLNALAWIIAPHELWPTVAGAGWIWGDATVQEPAAGETQTFERKFGWSGTVTTATLTVSSDDAHSASLNDSFAGSKPTASHVSSQGVYDVKNLIAQGNNELAIEVTNIGTGSEWNPAGLAYKLEVTGTGDCEVPYIDGGDRYTVYGYVWHDENKNDEWDGHQSEEDESDDEDPLAGWEVKITNGSETRTTTTGANGYYEFHVPAGTWTITETMQNDWNQTFPNSGSHVVTVPAPMYTLDESESIFASIMSALIPTALAQALPVTFGSYDFGNVYEPSSSDGGGGGGSSSSRSPRCDAFELDGDELSWKTRYGYDLAIEQNGSEIFSTTDNDEVDEGTFKVTSDSNDTFVLTVNRGSKDDTCTIGGVLGASDSRPSGQVLGASDSMPVGAPNTGAGGTSPLVVNLPTLFAILNANAGVRKVK